MKTNNNKEFKNQSTNQSKKSKIKNQKSKIKNQSIQIQKSINKNQLIKIQKSRNQEYSHLPRSVNAINESITNRNLVGRSANGIARTHRPRISNANEETLLLFGSQK